MPKIVPSTQLREQIAAFLKKTLARLSREPRR